MCIVLDDFKGYAEILGNEEFYLDIDNSSIIISIFGEIIEAKVVEYYKYTFTIELTTEKAIVCYRTNGNVDEIYKYETTSLDLSSHMTHITMSNNF